MRSSLPAIVAGLALLLPIAGSAQVSMGVASSPGITFQAGSATPRSDAPLRDSSSGRHGDRGGATGGDLFLADEHTYAPRYDRRIPPRHHHRPPSSGMRPYFVPGAAPFITRVHALRLPISETDAGILKLVVEPPSAQVFIDGLSFRDSGLETRDSPDLGTRHYLLEAGVHRVELEAEGFQPASFDVRIRPGDTLTISPQLTSLEKTDQRAAAASTIAASTSAKTFYVIPRCYAGDRMPDVSQLPAGCDPTSMKIIPADR